MIRIRATAAAGRARSAKSEISLKRDAKIATPSNPSRLTAWRVPVLTTAKNNDTKTPHFIARQNFRRSPASGRLEISASRIASGTVSMTPCSIAGTICRKNNCIISLRPHLWKNGE